MLMANLFFIVSSMSLIESANILGIMTFPVKSHSILFETLLKRLAEKGHDVDYVTHFLTENNPERYNELSIHGSLPLYLNNMSVHALKNHSVYELIKFLTISSGVESYSKVMKTEVLQSLKNSTKQYDLIITHLFGSDAMLGFGHLFNAPIVSLTTSLAFPWINERLGNPDNPSYVPNFYSTLSSKMSLYERIKNTILWIMTRIWYNYLTVAPSNQLVKDFFGPNTPSLENLIRNTSLVLVNSHFSMQQARPTVPNFIEVGGLHIREPQSLFQDLEYLVSNNSFGVIYLSMGSMVVSETFDSKILQAMFNAFAELPYTVLWKALPEKFPKGLTIPENVYFRSWMPQIDILCHPNVKLFINHGGLLGSQEAVYCAVPRIGIPFYGDQEGNIRMSEKLGIGIKLPYSNINKKSFLQTIKQVLGDVSYKHNVEKISQLFKDRPMSPLDTAVYWVEYVIRYKGAPHLRSAGADLHWYQYYLVDVAFILLFGLFVLILLIVYGLKLALYFINGKQKYKVK
ncbi:UDP-glycosyltransferase UGT5-like [Tribolium madens]|uniref:UDP-glycosyltransferase UGT5-like n=1 Tax=Tribolium madens TaxID=41895 RepID=UPI001CF729A1|nr:UDP-glycosyltransferase UGT5-like [Tribolium madens]